MNDEGVRRLAKASTRDAFALIRALHHEDRVAASRMIDALDHEECAWTTASLARTAASWAEIVVGTYGGDVDGMINQCLAHLDEI